MANKEQLFIETQKAIIEFPNYRDKIREIYYIAMDNVDLGEHESIMCQKAIYDIRSLVGSTEPIDSNFK